MSVGRAMSLKDFRRYLEKLRVNLVGHEGAATKGIHSGVMRAVTIVQQATLTAPPASDNGSPGAFNTGAYRAAWSYQLLPRGGRIFNRQRYADVIERGRRKNRKGPPPKEIELWAMRKLGLSKEEAKSASFAISHAIGKRGLKPRHVLKSSNAEITRVVMEEMRNEIRAALKRSSKR